MWFKISVYDNLFLKTHYTTIGLRSSQNIMIKIIEQPAANASRFRYECEGRSAGSIPGASSTPENRTYPTIKIINYTGKAIVVVSAVTHDQPYRPHPHNLIGKGDGFKHGIFQAQIDNESMTYTFNNLGIQCVKKKDMLKSLKIRKDIKVDPFKGRKESNKFEPSTYDLSVIRLAFQVFLPGQQGKYDKPLEPIVSDPIYDKKTNLELTICKLSHCSASCAGGQQIILLCEKVIKEDIQVRFFEEIDGKMVWEAYGTFIQGSVHKQFAITLKTPKYNKLFGKKPFKCFIQLFRPSDKQTSAPLPFDFIPMHEDTELNRKRQRNDLQLDLLRNLQAKLNQQKQPEPNSQESLACASGYHANTFNTNAVEEKPINNEYIPNVWEANHQYLDKKTVKMQQQDHVPNLNFSCPNLTSQTINYNQYIISPQETLKIPENLIELIDPQYNPNKLISSPGLDLEGWKMKNSF